MLSKREMVILVTGACSQQKRHRKAYAHLNWDFAKSMGLDDQDFIQLMLEAYQFMHTIFRAYETELGK